MDFLARLFDTNGFVPRWNCGNWTGGHGWLHILSDLGIWSAYFAIPLVLAYFVLRRRDLPFRTIFVLFVAFILLCGMTHLMEAIIFWHPAYRLAGVIKLVTAVVSWVTVFSLMRVVPGVLTMRTPEELEREIAARIAAEEALQRANAELERRVQERTRELSVLASIVESSDDVIISKSLDGRIQSWNAGAEQVFGYPAEEAVGKHISLIIPPERMQEEDEIIRRLKMGERIKHFDTVRLRRDGQQVPVSVTTSPIRDETGQIIAASKIARDITERKRSEEELRRLAAQLSEADRRKDEFLATLAHELRNPLAPLRNAVQIFRIAADQQTRENARAMMERQLTQLVHLVDDLLDVSRITSGKLQLRKEQVALKAVVDNAIEIARPLIDRMRHALTVKLPDEKLVVDADLTRLGQVLANLLNNSAKYTDPGGRIWLTVERQGSDVVLSVRDTGIGIAAEQLPSLFTMFNQGSRALEQTQGGLGIGLTLVKRLVEMHGGSCEARSEGVGKGSEFIVRLPVVVETLKSEPANRQRERAACSSLRILIVDDNRDAADSLSIMLQMAGNETRIAYDGLQGLEHADAFRPDVLLLDIGLPKLNGYEVCRRIRGEPWGKNMVLIAITGWGHDNDRRSSQEAGFDHHLVKPVDLNGLLNMLAQLQPVK